MNNKYFKYISDEDMMRCIDSYSHKYKEAYSSMDIEKFYKNKVDPVKMMFDKYLLEKTWEKSIEDEILRQRDKSVNQNIGKLHLELLSCLKGCPSKKDYRLEKYENKLCVKSTDNSIFIFLNNKHNTENNINKIYTANYLQNIAKKHPNSKIYLATVIGQRTNNRIDKNIINISIDELYSILTEEELAFNDLINGLEKAIEDYSKENKCSQNNDTVVSHMMEEQKKGITILEQIKNDSFRGYLGFDKNEANKYIDISNAVSKRQYNVLDLFAGAGGLALGLEEAGFKNVGLVEQDKYAVRTLVANRPKWNVIQGDVVEIAEKGIRNYIDKDVEVDLLTGRYLCQSPIANCKQFGLEDIIGTKFYYYTKILEELMPKMFLVEDRINILIHNTGNTLDMMMAKFAKIGYKITFKKLNAWDYNVAQSRERVIIVGVRSDLSLDEFEFPEPNEDKRPVLKDIFENVPDSKGVSYPEKKKSVLELVPQGGYFRDFVKDIRYNMPGRRISWDKPCPTITSNPRNICHPDETRPLTTREYARIQTFPDNWIFEGSCMSVYRQISYSVPINLGKAVGKSIVKYLDKVKCYQIDK